MLVSTNRETEILANFEVKFSKISQFLKIGPCQSSITPKQQTKFFLGSKCFCQQFQTLNFAQFLSRNFKKFGTYRRPRVSPDAEKRLERQPIASCL